MNLQLLKRLCDGSFHSGADLAKCLAVSRTTIWNQIQALQQLGVDIHSVRGKGYRIPGGLELVDELHLRNQLDGLGVLSKLDHLDLSIICESTNLSAQRAVAAGRPRSLFITEYQSGGRGRRGRSWASPLGANLYFSLSWPFSGGVTSLEGLSLAVGVAIKRALSALHIDDVELKWPNDLLLNERKLGGVLIEVGGDLSGDCEAVIGVGLNVRMPESTDTVIDQPWSDLRGRIPKDLSRSDILAVVMMHLIEMLETFAVQGFAPFVDVWHQANAFQGRLVSLIMGERTINGVCMGVDRTGALRLMTEAGEQLFQGGEVSLRANQ